MMPLEKEYQKASTPQYDKTRNSKLKPEHSKLKLIIGLCQMATIRLYQDIDGTLWDSYVLNHPSGTFFHLIGWKKVIEKTFRHKSYYLVAGINGNRADLSPLLEKDCDAAARQHRINPTSPTNPIVGILPLFSVRSFIFGKSLVSIPFAAYGGVLADSEEIASQLIRQAQEITRSEGLDYLELKNRDGGNPDLLTKDLYFVFRREIFEDLDSNMMAIPRKSRRMVRVGEKEGLSFEFGQEELIPTFYEIFAKSYHRLGSPVFSIKLFRNLIEEFKEKTNILIIRDKKGKPISSVMTFFYKNEVLPYYAGSLLEYRDVAPNDFMYWQLMKYGCENGYRVFDFGRSKVDTGSYDFKRHWGFEPQPLRYQYCLNGIREIPNISPANPKYQKKIEMWQKIPLWATKVIGPYVVKYIP
jgi:FemAB-related protein (PEP-CTERM system-associated)